MIYYRDEIINLHAAIYVLEVRYGSNGTVIDIKK